MAVNMNERDRLSMHSIIRLVFFCVFLSVASSATSTAPPATVTTTTPTTTTTTTTTTIPTTTAQTVSADYVLGQCPCDVTGNACDVGCCCDGDCSVDDKDAFQCLSNSQSQPEENRVCFPKELFLFENHDSVRSETTEDGQFCIYPDESGQVAQVYSRPNQVDALTVFQEYKDQFSSLSPQTPPVTDAVLNASFYQSGDPIYTVTSTEALGMLGLPRPLTSTDCVDGNPAAYLQEQTESCVRRVSDLSAQCASLPALNARTFFAGFRVVTSPQLFQSYNISVNETDQGFSLYDSGLTVAVKLDNRTSVSPLQCRDNATGTITPCLYTSLPSPSMQGGQCSDMLYEVGYTVVTNGTEGILDVYARFVLTTVPVPASAAFNFSQTFSASFQSVRSGEAEERSGTLGYVVGQPLLAGVRNVTTDRIELNTDRERYMTLAATLTSGSGSCTTGSEGRVPVLFGHDVQTGCVLRVTANNLTELCGLTQETIITSLEFDSVPQVSGSGYQDPLRYVGYYGNASPTSGNWVKILYQNRPLPPAPTPLTSSCPLSLSIHVQVMFANIGAKVNPQPVVIGVAFTYDDPVNIQVTVPQTGPVTLDVPITTSVTFLDVSRPAVNYDPRPSIYDPKDPDDFFYPFVTGGAVRSPPTWTLVIVMMMMMMVVVVLERFSVS